MDTLGLAGERLAVLSYPRSPTLDSGELAVFDLATGAQVASAATGGPGLTPTVLDIRSDGTVAYVTYPPTATAASCRGTLFVLAPGAAPRTLASGVCQLAKLAADEVVAKRKTKLVAVPLSGSEHTLVNLGRVAVVAADAQNTGKVGFAMPTCAGDTAIRFLGLATEPDDAGPAACPLRIASGSSHVAANRSFRVRLRCRRGCGGFVSLKRHGATLVEKPFEHAAGSFWVRLRLTKSLLGELRRRGSLSARITTSTEARSGRTVRHAHPFTLAP